MEYKPDPSVVGEESLRALGYSDAVTKRQALAHATLTQAKYKSMWTLFTVWTRDRKTKSKLSNGTDLDHVFRVPDLTLSG